MEVKFWLLIFVLSLFLGFNVYTYVYFKTECKNSQDNPFVYAAQRSNAVYCSCILPDNRTLNFNKEKAWFVVENKPFNFSESIMKGGIK